MTTQTEQQPRFTGVRNGVGLLIPDAATGVPRTGAGSDVQRPRGVRRANFVRRRSCTARRTNESVERDLDAVRRLHRPLNALGTLDHRSSAEAEHTKS
jgi:hypothetical protein